LDFGAGKSENVIVLREGNRYSVEAHGKREINLKLPQIYTHFRRLSLLPQQITGDAADAEMLGYLPKRAGALTGNRSARLRTTRNLHELERRSMIKLCAGIEKCEVILPDDPDIIPQLTRRKRTWNLAGKQGAENKRVMQETDPKPRHRRLPGGAHSIRTLPLAPARDFGGTQQDWNILCSYIRFRQSTATAQWAAQGHCSMLEG